MKSKYSIYEAKAKLSEIIRQVKRRRRIKITERGQEVAEIIPAAGDATIEQRIADLAAAGIVSRGTLHPPGDLAPVTRRPGALRRFLESRA